MKTTAVANKQVTANVQPVVQNAVVNSMVNGRTAYRQAGAAITDKLVWIILAVAALAFIAAQVPGLYYKFQLSAFQSDSQKIVSAAKAWKKMRPNFTGVSMAVLCAPGGDLSESICGAANNGVATNQFGGNWTVTANTNPGLLDVTATVPNDPDRIADIADTIAPSTRGQCAAAAGCSTLTTTGTSVRATY
ncbi:hypothetical protein M2404_003885 [Rheinheimera pacifica]|uniref:hypothetical protein n=1 Tax=Rheinheimera pacifica TaxID=173990 RepID=UPI00216888D3|nr:hypothetical protein [Rheinheimera pacifica]MCS4309513.1 hypothetical protein [Rheinheimera pacifica]